MKLAFWGYINLWTNDRCHSRLCHSENTFVCDCMVVSLYIFITNSPRQVARMKNLIISGKIFIKNLVFLRMITAWCKFTIEIFSQFFVFLPLFQSESCSKTCHMKVNFTHCSFKINRIHWWRECLSETEAVNLEMAY